MIRCALSPLQIENQYGTWPISLELVCHIHGGAGAQESATSLPRAPQGATYPQPQEVRSPVEGTLDVIIDSAVQETTTLLSYVTDNIVRMAVFKHVYPYINILANQHMAPGLLSIVILPRGKLMCLT